MRSRHGGGSRRGRSGSAAGAPDRHAPRVHRQRRRRAGLGACGRRRRRRGGRRRPSMGARDEAAIGIPGDPAARTVPAPRSRRASVARGRLGVSRAPDTSRALTCDALGSTDPGAFCCVRSVGRISCYSVLLCTGTQCYCLPVVNITE
ncbi:hypothetical protein MICRO8M_130147 [Microbacterium sp. 8M]|nr:hypothetical protein MICRO8M_130147 [Microbacterium sp. 8M]